MKLIISKVVCPETFKAYGPICLEFKWDIYDDGPWDWMEEKYPGESKARLRIMSDRMVRVQPIHAYFDNHDDAMLFKLTLGGK